MDPAVDRILRSRRGSGDTLPTSLQTDLGAAFGRDLSDIRIHNDAESSLTCDQVQADAFSYGSDLYFRTGEYRPHTQAGRRLLAHEVAHVVQGGRDGTASGSAVIGRADDAAERSADELAASALGLMSNGVSSARTHEPAGRFSPPRVIQRYFAFNGKAYEKESDFTKKDPVTNALKNEPGLLKVAMQWALDKDKDMGEYKTPQELKDALSTRAREEVSKQISAQAADDGAVQEILTLVGTLKDEFEPKGWGHIFSNAKHGVEMGSKGGAKRAQEEKREAIGVWKDEKATRQLLRRFFGKLQGKEGMWSFIFPNPIPAALGQEIDGTGKALPCSRIFLKINTEQIIISAYPHNEAAPNVYEVDMNAWADYLDGFHQQQ